MDVREELRSRGRRSIPSTALQHYIESDEYYLRQVRSILHASPQSGPPLYPVRLLDHVYIGNQRNADNIVLLQRLGITHVLNCAGMRRYDFTRSPYPHDSGVKGFLMFSALDSESYDITRHFDEAFSFLDRVKKSKGKALVHCNLGVNRSGAVVAAYLMVAQRQTLLQVINFLKLKRFVILTNKGFRLQLVQFARSRNLLDPVFKNSDDVPNDDHFPVDNVDSSANFLRSLSLNDPNLSRVDKKESKTWMKHSTSSDIDTFSDFSVDTYSCPSNYRSLPRKSTCSERKLLSSEEISKAPRSISASRNPLPTVEITFSLEPKESPEKRDADRISPDTKSRLKPSSLLPVMEKDSSNTSTTSSSNKFSGFWTLLGSKRKPIRSTSYSNVTTSVTGSSSSHLSESLTKSSDDPSSSLSNSRPFRLYKRSCTDSEVYKVSRSEAP